MSEEQSVTHKTVGFSFSVSIEREIRDKTKEVKYPDKTIVKASLGGHTTTLEGAKEALKTATELVRKQTEEVKV